MRKYSGLLTVFKKVYIYILARRNVGISKFEEKLRPSIENQAVSKCSVVFLSVNR